MQKSIVLLIATSLLTIALYAQDFKAKHIEAGQGKITVYYDLADAEDRTYTISLYSSRDNFMAPLEKVSGDVGLEVKAGTDRKIVWDALAELGPAFDGKISLEVRGRVYIPFVRFERFEEYKAIKRGKTYQITWTGGTPQNILQFELYKGDSKTGVVFNDIANTGKYSLQLPKSVKTGKDYYFKVTDTKNKDEIVFTGKFAIKPKVPLVFKAIPVVGIGALIYLLTGGESGTKNIPDPVDPK